MGNVAGELGWPPLHAESLLYRAYPFPNTLNRNKRKPEPNLFYRRAQETGLSVGLSPEAVTRRVPRNFGMCRLKVGATTDCGNGVLGCPDPLSIVQDAEDHAEIRGRPTRNEDQERALRIAKYLVRICEDSPLPCSS